MVLNSIQKTTAENLRKMAFDNYKEAFLVYSRPEFTIDSDSLNANFIYSGEDRDGAHKTFTPVVTTILGVIQADSKREGNSEMKVAQQDARFDVKTELVKVNVLSNDLEIVRDCESIVWDNRTFIILGGPVRRAVYSFITYDFWLKLRN